MQKFFRCLSGVDNKYNISLASFLCGLLATPSANERFSSMSPGAIIRDGDRKRAISSIGVGSMISDNIFGTDCAIGWGTRVCIAARIFADVAQGKWRPKFLKSFMLLAHNSRLLWQSEFRLSIFAVSCFSLSEDSAEFRYVPLYIADQVEFRCSFYKTFTLLQSKFHI